MRFNIGALSGIIEIMKKGIISILLLIVITLTVRADYKVFEKVDPASIWNRDELYKTPKTWKYEGFLKSDVKSIWIEGEPYKGKPTRSFAFYGIPSHASKNNKVPAMVLIHGGLGTAYDNWVRLWVKRGYAAICVDTCGSIPIRDMKGQWMSHPDGGPRGWGRPDMVDEPIKDQWPYHAVAAVMRSHSFIRSLECVDESKIGVTGVSWGGFLTCVAAAADERFAFAASVYGCGFNYEEGGLLWSKEGGEKWSKMWDASVFLPYAKIPFLWLDGTNDFAFSLDRLMRSSDLAQGPQYYCFRLRMKHSHGAVSEAPKEIYEFAKSFCEKKVKVLTVSSTEFDGDDLTVAFDANGRKPVKAFLLWTNDGKNVKWTEREWQEKNIADFDPASGVVTVKIPNGAYQAFVNIVADDSFIASSRIITVVQDNAANGNIKLLFRL